MADFKKFFALTSINEGGYVSPEEAAKKHDSGGETYRGISRNNWPDWKGWHIIDAYKPQATFPHILVKDQSLDNLVVEFYKTTQWDDIDGDQIANQSIANFLADWGVTAGMGVPVKHLQGIVGTTTDGAMGPKTLAATNAYDQADLFEKLKAERIQFYKDVVEAHPDDEGELDGWIARTNRYEFTA